MASRGNDKGLGDWLDNQDVCQMLNISPRTLQTLRDNGTFLLRQAAKPSGPILKSTARCTISLWMWRVFFMSVLKSRFWVTIWQPNSFTNPPQFAFSPNLNFPRSSPSCLYFRSNCVNLPKSLHFYKLFT